MNPDREYLTKEKFDSLQKELEYLKTTRRKEVADALEYAKSLGDLSENQEYQEARDGQGVLEDRINRLDAMLKHASIVSTHDTDSVTVGSVITILKEGNGSSQIFTIVGSEEADAAQGRISMRSPLGSSALGKAKGDTFSFQTPSGMMSYKIIDIK
ncbi:MAG: transcription elongation factor GreA [bacterium]|nr:transcription elongation factor GreA [bacterium]